MKLITWNVQWCRGCDGRVDPARIVAVARDMADFDVLCLQEVARNYPSLPGSLGEDQFETLAGLLPDYAVIKGAGTDVIAPEGNRREFGNALITRLPVVQAFRHLLPWPADASVPGMQRAAIEVVLQLSSGAPLRVTTTHLEYYSAKQRAAQVERLRELQVEAAGHASDSTQSKKKTAGRSRVCRDRLPGFSPPISISGPRILSMRACRRRSLRACPRTVMSGTSAIPAGRTHRRSACTIRSSGRSRRSAATSSS
jgi:hypothetical protein